MLSSFLCVYQGLRNDFKAAMEKIDQEYLAELIKQQVCHTLCMNYFLMKDVNLLKRLLS